MRAAITHRGPDDSGCWLDQSSGLALGHTRLPILDLSPAGHQPILSACARFVIVFIIAAIPASLANFRALNRKN
jgi:asparagine synthase (glutamine-hydrolysing)